MKKEQQILTTGKIAKYCHVNIQTVLKWIADGKLVSYKLPSGGNRVQLDAFLEFLKQYGMPVPKEFEGFSKTKILIVDDEPNIVKSIERSLRSKGYLIESAHNGFDAGQKVVSFGPDIIILDIRMPRLDGYGVLENLRQNPATRNIKVIVISGHLEDDGIQRLNEYGVEAVFEKPFDDELLSGKVQELMS